METKILGVIEGLSVFVITRHKAGIVRETFTGLHVSI